MLERCHATQTDADYNPNTQRCNAMRSERKRPDTRAGVCNGAVTRRTQRRCAQARLRGKNGLHGQYVLSLALVVLELQTNLAHALTAFSRLDLVGLFAFRGCLGAVLLPHLLFAMSALLFEAFVDVDSTALVDLSSSVRPLILVLTQRSELADEEAVAWK